MRRLTGLIAIPLRGALDILAPQATHSLTGLGCGLVLITHISQTMELHSCLPGKYQQHCISELRINCINIQFVLWCSDGHTLKQELLFGIVLVRSPVTPLKIESPRTGCKTLDLANSSPGVTVIACVFWGWARDCSSRVDKSSLG